LALLNQSRFYALLVLVALFPRLNAQSPQQAPDPSNPAAFKAMTLDELSQIEVTTPSKEPVSAFRTPAAIFVITSDDILRSGVTTIPDALRLAPGVEVAQIDANKWSVGIRGFGSRLTRSVLVLIDGRTVYTPLFDGTYWEVQNVMLEDVDRIEVIRGPGGTIWGPNAVDGVINIISKDSKNSRGVLATAGGGNYEQGFGNFRYGGGNDKDFTYRFYGMGFTRSPEYHSDGRNFDDWREAQGGFRLDWNENDKNLFTLQGDIYDEKAGESVQATSYTPPYSQIIDGNALLSGGNIMGRWKKIFSDSNNIQVQAYYDRTSRWEPNFAEIRNTFDIDFLQSLALPARQHVTWGLGARVQPIDDTIVVSGLQFLPLKRTDYLLTAFLQDEISLVDQRLSLTVGTKFLATNFTHGLPMEPSVRLLYTPDTKQSFWAAWTHALRTPSDSEEDFYLLGFIETTASGTPYFARFNPNPGFAPEQMNGYEFGYRRLLGKKVSLDATAFYNHYHDLFSEDITGATYLESDPPPVHYLLPADFANGLYGYTKGVEVAPEWRPTSFWRLRGSYSFLHTNIGKSPNSQDVGSAPGIVGSSPQHQATIESGFDVSKKIQVDIDWRYVSSLPAQMVPGYSTANARIAWQVNPHVGLSVVGDNLFQPYHYEDGGDPGPLVGIKRSAYAKLTWTSR
jgi:iron complex outermembrane receptor protein